MKKHFQKVTAFTFFILAALSTLSFGADYPTKPITLVCCYGPGGGADITTRAVASALEPLMRQPVAVLNKPGATGSVGMGFIATSKPDGYTLGLTPGSLALTPYFQQVPYDITKDFTYIAALGNYTEPFCVPANSPFKTMKDLIDYAKQNPNKAKVGVQGVASSAAMMIKFVGEKAGVQWTMIPYTSDGENITALLGGHIHAGVNQGGQAPQVRAGTIRMLAVNTAERLKDYPDVPTLIECGYDFTTLTLIGIAGPKGLPEPILHKLEEALAKVWKAPVFLDAARNIYLNPVQELSKDYEKRVVSIYKKMAEYSKMK
jgi:tripartite-type tricarboxylate transporter receptor subunit TctC